jgi:hypothetical protein
MVGGYGDMPDFPIDPELRIRFPIDPELRFRAGPEQVLRRTNEALNFVRTMAQGGADRAWQDVLEQLEAIRDEWSAMEAVVNLELLLEAEGRLIEEKRPKALLHLDESDLTPRRSRFAR